ncbi:acetyl-CoA carboxylase biotin carboxyl carrier protein [Flavobacteriales bacterium]|jgi:acetyl-CoA carboxylase biotin carboxyl carrier protein|nr:acetyl-CoA carboxylase biotin carboxyl carrier protein [Flavobacteriales bacterium]MDA7794360.1 acetyl-CoA carboxylase biotin carboxyl carrier protein [Flavobacteriales bacterium]
MDIKEIQELIKFVAKSGATEVNLEIDNVKISIKSPAKKGALPETTIIQQIPVAQSAPAVMPVAAAAPSAETQAENPHAEAKKNSDEDKYITIKSPMIGTFYRKPSPDKDTFVNIGDTIKPGDVLCVVEAMKLFNEIESEVSGKIVKVLVDDSSPVEYDQPLFLVDPS